MRRHAMFVAIRYGLGRMLNPRYTTKLPGYATTPTQDTQDNEH